MSHQQVKDRCRKGTLHRVHRGVYRVGHTAPSTEATYLGAVLACNPGAHLAGKACGHLYRLTKGGPPPPEVIALVDKRRPGITTRRTKLRPRDTRKYRGIPTLTVAATLLDLAATDVDLGFAVFRADSFHGVTVDAVAAAARRRGPFPGIKKLRALYTGDDPILLSELERRFLTFLAESGFPTPVTNRKQDAHYVDCR